MAFLRKVYRKSSALTAWPRCSALFSPFKKTREVKKILLLLILLLLSSVKIMISRLQTNGTSTSQRL